MYVLMLLMFFQKIEEGRMGAGARDDVLVKREAGARPSSFLFFVLGESVVPPFPRLAFAKGGGNCC
jgi:hypothetical protein